MNDVARMAGVSVATVSAVINKNKYVSPELTERVEQAIARLHYRPNMVARSLKVQETKTIGLVVTKITSPIISPLVRTAQQVAEEAGFDVVLINTDDDLERERKSIENLLAKRVDGLLVRPISAESQEALIRANLSVPIVTIERHIPGIECVTTNNEQISYQAVRHLIGHGYTRIGLNTIPIFQAYPRLEGYRRALEEQDLYDESLVREADFFGEHAYETALELISGQEVDAIFTTSQSTTLGVIKAARTCELRIPEDMALLGYDDTAWMEVMSPPVSAVRQPIRQMTHRAMELLFSRIQGNSQTEKQHILESTIVFRESCGC